MREDDNHTFDQFRDHMAAIGCILADWLGGRINLAEKRQRIMQENKRYYKDQVKSAGSNEYITEMPRA